MTDLTWLLVPLLVLPIVVLFRFAGCGSFGTEKKPPAPPSPPVQPLLPLPVDSVAKPKYATSILDKKEFVIAYWRLLEPAGSVQAIDEKGFRNGLYKEGQPLFLFEPPPGSNAPASEAAPGTFQAATNLIASDTTASRLFNGAYVHVEFLNGLYTDEFTIEAWVKPQWGPNMAAYRHTLFDASGTYALPGTEPALRGFLIFADLDGDVDGDSRWQVALGPGGDVFTFRPKVALGKTVHLEIGRAHV